MRFDPCAKIVRRDGRQMVDVIADPTPDNRQNTSLLPLTHGILATRALDAQFDDERHLKAEDGMRRFLLGTRIVAAMDKGETLDLAIEEAALIKECARKMYAPGVWGQLHLALDEAAKAPTLTVVKGAGGATE